MDAVSDHATNAADAAITGNNKQTVTTACVNEGEQHHGNDQQSKLQVTDYDQRPKPCPAPRLKKIRKEPEKEVDIGVKVDDHQGHAKTVALEKMPLHPDDHHRGIDKAVSDLNSSVTNSSKEEHLLQSPELLLVISPRSLPDNVSTSPGINTCLSLVVFTTQTLALILCFLCKYLLPC